MNQKTENHNIWSKGYKSVIKLSSHMYSEYRKPGMTLCMEMPTVLVYNGSRTTSSLVRLIRELFALFPLAGALGGTLLTISRMVGKRAGLCKHVAVLWATEQESRGSASAGR